MASRVRPGVGAVSKRGQKELQFTVHSVAAEVESKTDSIQARLEKRAAEASVRRAQRAKELQSKIQDRKNEKLIRRSKSNADVTYRQRRQPSSARAKRPPTDGKRGRSPNVRIPVGKVARRGKQSGQRSRTPRDRLSSHAVKRPNRSSRVPAEATTSQRSHRDIPRIRVAVRKRPLNSKEAAAGASDCAVIHSKECVIQIAEPKVKVDLTKFTQMHDFVFDEVFGARSTNTQIYASLCQPLVDTIFDGGRAICFAYGQTGSGKTFTMMGTNSGPNTGIYALAARDIFAKLGKLEGLSVQVSFYEIYGGKLFDLLQGRTRLITRVDGRKRVNIVGLSSKTCQSPEVLMHLISSGNETRQTGCTGANINSSRSHAILTIDLIRDHKRLHGRFSFVDLAGSERGADTANNDRQTRMEGAEINKSLLALKECIRALDQKSSHTPFRGSKLTQVLKESFVGNCKTVMIANVSPTDLSCENTLNTLRYANRVKELKKPKGMVLHNAYEPWKESPKKILNHHPVKRKNSKPAFKDVEKSPTSSDDGYNSAPERTQTIDLGKVAPSLDVDEFVEDDEPRIISPPLTRAKSEEARPVFMRAPRSKPKLDRTDKERLTQLHADMVTQIFEEEDRLVKAHRIHIDECMVLVKEDMQLLKEFDRMTITTDGYVASLESIIKRKSAAVIRLRDILNRFKTKLKDEERLSNSLTTPEK